jgi:hypothetical protein
MSKRKEKIPATLRNIVWNTYIGNKKIGYCYCCKTEIISTVNFHCGHVISEKNGGNINIDNLRPICGHCNSSMGIKNMNEFMEKYGLNKKNIKYIDNNIENNNHEILRNMNKETLKKYCEHYGFRKSGSKNDLIERLNNIKNFEIINFDDINKINNISNIKKNNENNKNIMIPVLANAIKFTYNLVTEIIK